MKLTNTTFFILTQFCRRSHCSIRTWLNSQCRCIGSTTAINAVDVKPFSDIPGPKGINNFPFLGLALQFEPFNKHTLSKIHLLFKDFNREFGNIVRYRAGTSWIVLLFHPDDVQRICTIPQEIPFRAPAGIIEAYCKRNNVQESLASLQGSKWLSLRRSAQDQMLRPKIVSNYIPLINVVADDFINKLKKENNVDDCLAELMKYTTESIGLLSLNTRMGYFEDGPPKHDLIPHLLEGFEIFQKSFYSITKAYNYFRTPLYNKFEKEYSAFTRVITDYAEARIKDLENSPRRPTEDKEVNDLLLAFLSDPRLNDGDALALVRDLFAGGVDSTANAMVFLLHKLARNMDKQENLRKEVLSKIPGGTALEKDSFSDMPYLKACVKESFRMVPPGVISSSRKFDKDVTVGGYLIPKDTVILNIPHPMLENEKFFPRPKEFIPERWLRVTDLEGFGAKNIYRFTYTPFGYGSRSCIGQRFAENQIYVGIAKIIQNFRVHIPEDKGHLDFIYKTFATPTKHVKLSFEKL